MANNSQQSSDTQHIFGTEKIAHCVPELLFMVANTCWNNSHFLAFLLKLLLHRMYSISISYGRKFWSARGRWSGRGWTSLNAYSILSFLIFSSILSGESSWFVSENKIEQFSDTFALPTLLRPFLDE